MTGIRIQDCNAAAMTGQPSHHHRRNGGQHLDGHDRAEQRDDAGKSPLDALLRLCARRKVPFGTLDARAIGRKDNPALMQRPSALYFAIGIMFHTPLLIIYQSVIRSAKSLPSRSMRKPSSVTFRT